MITGNPKGCCSVVAGLQRQDAPGEWNTASGTAMPSVSAELHQAGLMSQIAILLLSLCAAASSCVSTARGSMEQFLVEFSGLWGSLFVCGRSSEEEERLVKISENQEFFCGRMGSPWYTLSRHL